MIAPRSTLALVGIVASVIAAIIFYAWWLSNQPIPWTPLAPAHQIADVPKVGVQIIAPLQVYTAVAKKKLNLPPAIQQDTKKSIVAATEIKPDTHQQTVITMVNTQTGDTETIVRREPLPWLTPANSGEIRIDYGYRSGQPITRLSAQQTLLQIKSLNLGINASLDSDGKIFGGAGVGWRW